MFSYSKLAQAAISAVSYLAEVEAGGRLSGSAEIAETRGMSRQLIAKVLTVLSRHGIVEGTPGPSGGYRLARAPGMISLLDVVRVFDNLEEKVMCPFGPHWCGNGAPCPLHNKLVGMHERVLQELASESFAQFRHSKSASPGRD